MFMINRIGVSNELRLISVDVNTVALDHNEFIDNAGFSLNYLIAEVTIRSNEFIGNKIYAVLVWIPYYYTRPEKFSVDNNVLIAIQTVSLNQGCLLEVFTVLNALNTGTLAFWG